MANVFLIGLERKAAAEVANVASVAHHSVFERSHSIKAHELSDAGIVFAGGTPQVQLPLLRRIRSWYPALPVVAVLQTFDMGDWLDALEAGATDYCWAPVGRPHIQWFMQSLMASRSDELNVPRQSKAAGASAR